MKKLLIAARPRLSSHLYSLLGTNYKITESATKFDALRRLDTESFDAIICGTQFDDGNVFSLINQARKSEYLSRTPILCIRFLESPLADSIQEGVRRAVTIAGGTHYLDANPLDDSEASLRINGLLSAAFNSQLSPTAGADTSTTGS